MSSEVEGCCARPKRGEDVFNTYVLVDRDGAVHMHNKDLPTMVENAYYTGGSDDGLVSTSQGSVGIAVCWETIRTATVRRLRGKVGLRRTRAQRRDRHPRACGRRTRAGACAAHVVSTNGAVNAAGSNAPV